MNTETTMRNDEANEINAMIPKRYLKAVSYFAAKKDVRYYLNGVFIKNGLLAATDGHVLGVIESDDIKGPDEGVILSLQSVKGILKREHKKALMTYITEGSHNYSGGDPLAPLNWIEGRYPDFTRLQTDPEDTSGDAGQFNPELLGKFQKAAKALHGGKKHCDSFMLHHNGVKMGAPVTINGKPEFKGLVMPWRVKG